MRKIILLVLVLGMAFISSACSNGNIDTTPGADSGIPSAGNHNTPGTNNTISPTDSSQPAYQTSGPETPMNDEDNDDLTDFIFFKEARTGYTTSVHTPVFEKSTVTAGLCGIYEPGTVVQVLGLSAQFYCISVDGVTGYTPCHSLAFDPEEVPAVPDEAAGEENMAASVVEKEVVDAGTVMVRYKNLSDKEQISYNCLMLPYDQDGVLLPDQIQVLSADMNPSVKSGELSMEGLIWEVEEDVCTIEVCLLDVAYLDDGLTKTWFNPYIGDWLLNKLEEAGLQ